MRSAISTCAEERVSLVLVGGVAGVGKTRLVAEAAEWAATQRIGVLEGACLPLGSALPYGPFVELLGQEHFASGAGDRTGMFQATVGALADRADGGPLLVVVEDLHWADPSTCDLLVFCARILAGQPVVVVGTYRSDEIGTDSPFGIVLDQLSTAPWLRQLELLPLTRQEMADQISGIRGTQPSAELVHRVFTRSGGNPYVAEELLAADPIAERLPSTVRAAVLSRLERLDAAAQVVARILAVAGPRVHSQVLVAACDLDAADLDAGVAALTKSALVVTHGDCYEFRHALAQEAVRSALGPAERAETHCRVAELLTERPELAATTPGAGAAAERAYHWERAGQPRSALIDLIAAADAANSVTAPAETLAHLEQAMTLWDRLPGPRPDPGIDRLTLAERAGDAAVAAGRNMRAVELLTDVRDALPPTEQPARRATVLTQLARAQRESGRSAEAKATLDEAAELLMPHEESPALALVLARRAHLSMVLEQFTDGAALARRAVSVAVTTQAPDAEGLARLALGGCLIAGPGDDDEGVAEMTRGLDLLHRHTDLRSQVVAAYNTALYLLYLNRFEEALSIAGGVQDRLARLGAEPADLGLIAAVNASVLVRLGRPDDALNALAGTEPTSGFYDAFRRVAQAEVALARGDLDDARTLWDGLAGEGLDDEPQGREWMTYLGVQLFAGEGRWDAARQCGLAGLEELDAADPYPFHVCAHGLRAEADRVEAGARDPGGEPAVRAYLAALDRLLTDEHDRHRPPRLDSVTRAALARADAARARASDDPALWEAAVDAADSAAEPWPQAYARYRQAVALLTTEGGSEIAADLLNRSRTVADRMGATRLADEIAAAAERFRVGKSVEDAPHDPLGHYRLTRREAEVLGLVSSGASNREIAERLFISDKTASVHVTNILRKLGVSTRTQAAAIAYRARLASRPAAASDDA